MNHRPIRLFILALMLSLLSGCTREDLSMCRELTLKFRYMLNGAGQDMLASEVGSVRLYVFNDRGVLCNIVRVGRDELRTTAGTELDLATGRYSLVAWGGGSGDMMQHGYLDAHMIDAATNRFQTPAVVGQTTLDDLYLLLACTPLTEQSGEYYTPSVAQFDDLFYGSLTQLDYRKGEGARTETIDLIKNTNKLKVRINGLNYIGLSSARMCVLGRNGRYRSNNSVGDYARTVYYNPADMRTGDGSAAADIRLLRIDKEFHTAHPILLKIWNPEMGKEIFQPIDVVKTLLQAKDAAGNYLYHTQEDFDRQDEYLIEINAAELGVTISVEGWVIGTLEPSVE